MENYFDPGIKTKPAVHVGSQTIDFFYGIIEEQSWEGYYLAGATDNDVGVVRNYDQVYIDYWQSLMDNPYIVNILDAEPKTFLTEKILKEPKVIAEIKKEMHKDARLHVFLPTELEQQLADKLGIPLHGTPHIGQKYGTKSGIRDLAEKAKIPMAPGIICKNVNDVEKAIKKLHEQFPIIVVKHDLSVSGYFSKKVSREESVDATMIANEISGGEFQEKNGSIVVEGWIDNRASVCVHIEILPGKKPQICAAWQQVIDTDGISYMGAGPLRLSKKGLTSLLISAEKLAFELQKEGAIGSYGPDFIITADGNSMFAPDTAILIELNARIPMTAMPLEVVKKIKGKVGNGFLFQHVKLHQTASVDDILSLLKKEGLLITKKDKNARGVVPYNVGVLPWKIFDIAAIADSWEEAIVITQQVQSLFGKSRSL